MQGPSDQLGRLSPSHGQRSHLSEALEGLQGALLSLPAALPSSSAAARANTPQVRSEGTMRHDRSAPWPAAWP